MRIKSILMFLSMAVVPSQGFADSFGGAGGSVGGGSNRPPATRPGCQVADKTYTCTASRGGTVQVKFRSRCSGRRFDEQASRGYIRLNSGNLNFSNCRLVSNRRVR